MKDRVGRDVPQVNGIAEMLEPGKIEVSQYPVDTPLIPGHEVTQAQINVLESLVEQAYVICHHSGDVGLQSIDRVLSVLLQVHTRAVETRSVEESEQIQRMRMMQNIAPSYPQQASSLLGIKL